MSDHSTCQFCGGPATAWHGGIACCLSPRCSILHDWATWQPDFELPPPPPTVWHRLAARVLYAIFRTLKLATPYCWIIDRRHGNLKRALAAWVWSNEYFWWEMANIK